MIAYCWPQRRVRYEPELDELPVGTILTIPGSGVTALRDEQGWLLYGPIGGRDDKPRRDTTGSIGRNLPAYVARRGKRGWTR